MLFESVVANVLLLPLSVLLSLFLLDVVGDEGILLSLCLLLPPSLLLSPVGGVGGTASTAVFLSSDLCLFFIEFSEGIIVGGGGHFPFTGIEPSGHGTDREANVLLLLPPSPLLLSSAPLDGVGVAPPVFVGLSSDLLFFAAKTV